MPRRQPAPYFKKSHKAWYVQIGARQHRLSEDYDQALIRCGELLKAHKKAERFVVPGETSTQSLGTLAAEFYRVAFKDRSPRTRDWYEEKLAPLIGHLGDEFPAEQLKPLHVEQWVAAHPDWTRGTARTVWQAIQRLLRWGEKSGRIAHSTVCDYGKPKAGKRTIVIPPEEYARILENIRLDAFRDLVTVAWESGARPQELLKFEARHFDAAEKRLVLPPEEAKVDKWPRIVYLTDDALAIVERLVKERPRGRLFVNESGKPWTPMSVNCQFIAVQHRMGFAVMRARNLAPTEEQITAKIATLSPTRKGRPKTAGELREEALIKCRRAMAQELAPKYCLYHVRHSWLDQMLKRGNDPLTCAILLGHRDPSQLSKTYQHLSQSPDYLRAALNKRAAG